MRRTFAAICSFALLAPASAWAQRSIDAQPLAPLGPSAPQQAPMAPPPGTPFDRGGPPGGPGMGAPPPVDAVRDSAAPAGTPPSAAAPEAARVFCDQSLSFRLADPEAVPERYRKFIGIFSDAAWTPQLCAALIVESVRPDGTASIIYAFGPMGSKAPTKGGVLHGTGIIRDGELRFQNADGSQYAFRPLYSDLDGHYTTPQGQGYQSIFKKSF